MKLITGVLLTALAAMPVFAQKDASSRLTAATEDLHEMMNASDKGIPQDLIAKASCVVVIPNLKSGGFIIGGQYGKGFFTCRKGSGVGWSAPGSVRLAGGKFGLLIGGKETDVIMLRHEQERYGQDAQRQVPDRWRSCRSSRSGRSGFVCHDGCDAACRDPHLFPLPRTFRRS